MYSFNLGILSVIFNIYLFNDTLDTYLVSEIFSNILSGLLMSIDLIVY